MDGWAEMHQISDLTLVGQQRRARLNIHTTIIGGRTEFSSLNVVSDLVLDAANPDCKVRIAS